MSDTPANGSRSLDVKVAAIESEVAGLKTDVAGIRSAIDRLVEANTPKREGIAGWLSVIVALAGLLLWGAVREVDRIERDGKERTHELDERLQREMRDRDDVVTEKVKSLENRFDRVQLRHEKVMDDIAAATGHLAEAASRLEERISKRAP